jgi:cytochrome b subunit of formate dehydrogenase
VTSLGFTRVARCSDCHGAHDIQPSKDPRSKINEANILATCRRCHAEATANFTQYDPHADPRDRDRNPVLYYSAWFMTVLLVGVFVFFGTHTIFWGERALWVRWQGGVAPSLRKEEAYYWRFTLGQRILHGLLIVSFLSLVTTGMPLLYSQSNWAIWLSHTLGGFGVMGFFHRLSAVLLTALFLFHVAHVGYRVFIRKERGLIWGPSSLVPQPKDIVDVFRHFLWFIGWGSRPYFGRFAYWEKFDYWAVFLGMVIIGVSGYVLWFDEFFARFFPGWWFNVALLMHGEEALLAAGFIFAVHFFNTHLRPEKFPMDLVIFTGRVSEDELREERPEEYKTLVEEGKLASIRADPPPRWLRNLGWTVGIISVIIGLILFGLILMPLFVK